MNPRDSSERLETRIIKFQMISRQHLSGSTVIKRFDSNFATTGRMHIVPNLSDMLLMLEKRCHPPCAFLSKPIKNGVSGFTFRWPKTPFFASADERI